MDFCRIGSDVKLGKDVRIHAFVNLYGCSIGDHSRIGAFVEIQKNASVGKNVKVSSHTFICDGVTIEDNVFIGHNVRQVPTSNHLGGRTATRIRLGSCRDG
jgi:UDP-3-O-[3-hydroxymyristoyl] glucosamine N-acyltransferase